MNTKLHAFTVSDGWPLLFLVTAGQVSDYTRAAAISGGLQKAKWVLADRGHDAAWFRESLQDKGIEPGIPRRKSCCRPVKHNTRSYKRRSQIEILFG